MRSFTTVYTNNSRSNYQIRIHSRCFSLFVPHSFPFPIFPGKLPSSLLLARRFVRARMNGDLSRRWKRVCRTFFLAAGRRSKGEMGRKERGRGRFSTKINTYSRDFITDGCVTIDGRVRTWPRNDSASITRVMSTEKGASRAKRQQGDPAKIFGERA